MILGKAFGSYSRSRHDARCYRHLTCHMTLSPSHCGSFISLHITHTTHAHITYTQTIAHTHTHTHTHARVHTRTCAHTHACTHARVHTRTHAHTTSHTQTHTHHHTCTHYIHHTHTHTHTHNHTHTQPHTHTRLKVSLEEPEPRVHFALVCGAKSCPPIKTYSSKVHVHRMVIMK